MTSGVMGAAHRFDRDPGPKFKCIGFPGSCFFPPGLIVHRENMGADDSKYLHCSVTMNDESCGDKIP